MSGAEYKMDVYVVEKAGKLEIDKILVNKTKNDQGTSDSETGKVDIGNDLSKNGFNFVNTYAQEAGTGTDPVNPGTDPDVDYTNNGSLKVSKTINAKELLVQLIHLALQQHLYSQKELAWIHLAQKQVKTNLYLIQMELTNSI